VKSIKLDETQKEMLLAAMGGSPAGATGDEVLKAVEIQRKVKKANGRLLLEDAEYAVVREVTNRPIFRVFNDDVAAFINAIRNAEEYEVPMPLDITGNSR